LDFKTAVKRLSAGVTQDAIARALATSYYTVKQAKLEDGSAGNRSAPPGWEKGIAKLARKRSEELTKLADQLDPPEKRDTPIWGGIV
jgi:hypothetical protein